jgi:hypothetical protein
MTVRYTVAQAQDLGLLPSKPVRHGRKTETADGHVIDPDWLWMNEEPRGRNDHDNLRFKVMEFVRQNGWSCGYSDEGELPGLAYHASSAMHQAEKGWPDLTLIRRRDRRLIFAELKREDGELSARQSAVLDLLRCLVVDVAELPDGLPPMKLRSYLDGVCDGMDKAAARAPRIEVFVWRPSQLAKIAEVLR